MAKYVYPVVLTPAEEGGYNARFPDFESCYTQGDDLADALEMAKDVLSLTLCKLEDDGVETPVSTAGRSLPVTEGQIVSLITADTIEYRKFYDNKAIKKTLTIPIWLNTMAEKNGVNFSAILQKALKKELNITE